MVKGSRWAVKIYTDHAALVSILEIGMRDAHGRLARWQDTLMQYNCELIYRPNTDRIIKIADGLSRIPQHLMSEFQASDIDGKVTMAMRADANEKEESLIDKWEEDWEKWVKAKADKETRVEEADGNEQVEEAEEREDEKAGVDSNKELEETEINCSEEDR